LAAAGQRVADQVVQLRLSAEHADRLGPPGLPLLGVGAGFVLGRPGLQVRLLRQGQGFGRGRRSAVVGLEGRRQLRAADVDRRAA